VRELEDWLGQELLHRTTRHLRLADAGLAYLERCRSILDEVDDLERTSRSLQETPQGRINVTAPVFMGRFVLGPLLPPFLERHPGIQLNVQLMDRYVNLVEEGFDIAIRIARRTDSGLASTRLGEMRMVLVAAPACLDRHGVPAGIDDLRRYNCIVDSAAAYLDCWPLFKDGKSTPVRVAGNFGTNSGELVRAMALAGVGVALLPDFFVDRDLRNGSLVEVLGGAVNRSAAIAVVHPRGRHLSRSARVFVDYLETSMRMPGDR
jgi:DNA-binding transcriptional LysR family regulator